MLFCIYSGDFKEIVFFHRARFLLCSSHTAKNLKRATLKELEIAHAVAGVLSISEASEERLMESGLTFESLVARVLLEILAALLTQRQQRCSYLH